MKMSMRSLRKRWRRGAADVTDYGYPRGRGTYGTPRIFHWGEPAKLSIGAYCSIAEGVQIFLGGNHRLDWATTYPFTALWPQAASIPGHPATKGDVVIGNDVWIGNEAVILSGVTIGDGAVIGAAAVLGRDVEPYAIVAGNPARMVRKRFSEDVIRRLLALRWWDWDESRIERYLPLMLSEQIIAFLDSAEAEDIVLKSATSKTD